jgi:chemotaxis protein MotB
MGRRKRPEEHLNHEAWAIPYGDLITLLLAFFVVMYAVSSVNEGKYRIVSDSINAAFQGAAPTTSGVPIGRANPGLLPEAAAKEPKSIAASNAPLTDLDQARLEQDRARRAELAKVEVAVRQSLGSLISVGVVGVKQNESFVEVTIRTDLLFSSGSAELATVAVEPLQQLAATLTTLPNPVRVEGHTDDRPIATTAFPSNWELSAARAASVVRVLRAAGMDPTRLSVVGMGEFRPLATNTTADGRNANRRVALVIMASGLPPEEKAPTNSRPPAANDPATVTPVTSQAVTAAPLTAGTLPAP